MDTDQNGTLEKSEFLQLPQIASNPLAQRLLAVFDIDGSGDVDFKEFIIGISAFSAKGNKNDKLKCMLMNIIIFSLLFLQISCFSSLRH